MRPRTAPIRATSNSSRSGSGASPLVHNDAREMMARFTSQAVTRRSLRNGEGRQGGTYAHWRFLDKRQCALCRPMTANTDPLSKKAVPRRGWMLDRWTIIPVVAGIAWLITMLAPASGLALTIGGVALIGAVLAAVHHAEVVALRVGEPFGTLVLAVAVTVIEVGLMVSIMQAGGAGAMALPRDTVMAAIMIILGAVIGACLLVGGAQHHVQAFKRSGVAAAVPTLTVLAVCTLILPNYLISASGPRLSAVQLGFAGAVSLVLYVTFVFVQTVRHREYFLDDPDKAEGVDPADGHFLVSRRKALNSLGLLILCLVAVVLLAKALSPVIEGAVAAAGLPRAVVGVVIAGLVLLPEGIAAVRNARRNRLQTSLNLALGSALATIGLTIPTVAVLAIAMGWQLELGVDAKSVVLLVLTLLVTTQTLSRGQTTIMQGAVHLALFATFILTLVVP